jgi:hypothetical protein
MSRSRSGRTAREAVIAGRTSATSGTATVPAGASIQTIDGIQLDFFEDLVAYLDATGLAGTAPTMDVYLQRALRPNADPAVDADWEDFYHFPQVTTSAVLLAVTFPLVKTVANDAPTAQGHTRVLEAIAADAGRPSHWGDALRVREKMGGTVTTPSTWSLYLMGMRKVQASP